MSSLRVHSSLIGRAERLRDLRRLDRRLAEQVPAEGAARERHVHRYVRVGMPVAVAICRAPESSATATGTRSSPQPPDVGDRVHHLERRVRDVREVERRVERREGRQHGRERRRRSPRAVADVVVGGARAAGPAAHVTAALARRARRKASKNVSRGRDRDAGRLGKAVAEIDRTALGQSGITHRRCRPAAHGGVEASGRRDP